jgi:uncharacterized membrane protein YbaN (DUF454 family)
LVLLAGNIHFSLLNEQKVLFFIIPLLPILAVTAIFLLRVNFFYKIVEKMLKKILLGNHLANILDSFRAIVKNNKILLLSLMLCVLGHLTTLAAISSFSYFIYGKPSAIAAIAVSGMVILTGAVPVTPGNIGMTEFIAGTLFNLFNSEYGATVFLLWRVINLLFSLIGAYFYLGLGKPKTESDLSE